MGVTANLDKIRQRMDRIDAMPKEIRELIHEVGLTVVQAFLDVGVKKATHIRHLINTTRRGSLDVGTADGSAGWNQHSRTMCVIPMEPTEAMIEASMATVSGFDVTCTKHDKHKLRLRAAIKAGMCRIA